MLRDGFDTSLCFYNDQVNFNFDIRAFSYAAFKNSTRD